MGNAIPVTANTVSLPRRGADTHKGDYGKILIVGGSMGYTGAPTLCARAAVRAGAGLVYLGIPGDIWAVTAVKNTEAMPFPLPCDADGRLTREALPYLRQRWKNCNVMAIGPGLGRSEDIAELVRSVVEEYAGILVLDADALWAVSRDTDMLTDTPGTVIITPHAGEFAALGGNFSGDRRMDAEAFADQYGCITVLKGHGTVIAYPAGRAYVLRAGNPGMAKGGSGDVLTGILAAMLGQLPLEKAVVTAAWLHSAAGDTCAARLGEYGMTPSDIIEALPSVMKGITK